MAKPLLLTEAVTLRDVLVPKRVAVIVTVVLASLRRLLVEELTRSPVRSTVPVAVVGTTLLVVDDPPLGPEGLFDPPQPVIKAAANRQQAIEAKRNLKTEYLLFMPRSPLGALDLLSN